MIFVTVGTNEAPFERLLRLVDGLPVDEEVLVQVGHSLTRPGAATCVAFLPFDELATHVAEARAVVMHAGVGSIVVALRAGKRPIVVPRLRRFGEAVDDHQLHFAQRAAAMGYVTHVDDVESLVKALREQHDEPAIAQMSGTRLAQELRSYVEQVTR